MKRNDLKDGLTRIVDELVRQGVTLEQARQEFERQFIVAAIRSNQGNLGRSAQSMGVHRNTLRETGHRIQGPRPLAGHQPIRVAGV